MKKLSLITLLLIVAISCFAQPPAGTMANSIWKMRNYLTHTPYYGVRERSEQAPPHRSASFYMNQWKEFKANAWKDWQLTQAIEYDVLFPDPFILRCFASEESKFIICSIWIGEPDQYKEIICTATETGDYIDNIEGGFCYADWSTGEDRGFVFLKQYMVATDMNVVVYHIIPETNRDIAPEGNPPSFRGKRVDTTYKIDSDGKFVRFKEIIYKPATYTLNDLADKEKNIWEGKEEIASTRTF